MLNVRALIERVVSKLKKSHISSEVRVDVQTQNSRFKTLYAHKLVKNVLVNMLQSAFKKAQSNSRILVSTQVVSDSEIPSIFDDGIDL